MKALIQRVKEAKVVIGDGLTSEVVASINQGLLALIGIEKADNQASADRLLKKLLHYRVFADQDGKMNLGLEAVGGGLLLVSQFTLAADTQKGLRPGFSAAAKPEDAKVLYQYMLSQAQLAYLGTQSGVFGADMQVSLINDGPVTFMLES